MEQFVAWLAQLAPHTIYLVIALSTLLENVFPPTPSDVAVALGGFLSQRTAVSPAGVWLAGWLGNLSGTVLLYLWARRYGRRFVASPFGQRLLPGGAILSMEREYLRLGVAGIFLARLLPGFRSFVAPFVGLIELPALRALLPIAIASALWYGFLTWAGVRLGAEWDAISRFIGHLNRTLAIVALLAVAGLAISLWRRARARGPRRIRLLNLVRVAMGDGTVSAADPPPDGDIASQGAAALLNEFARADPALTLEERESVAEYLRERWGLPAERKPEGRGSSAGPAIADTAELASIVTSRYDQERRIALAERLYRIARSDGTLSRHEERLMLRVADLLQLGPTDLAEAERRAAS